MVFYQVSNIQFIKIPIFNSYCSVQIPVNYIGCSFKFLLKVGVEKSIVNAPRITDHGSTV
jgi:hypothetical protein